MASGVGTPLAGGKPFVNEDETSVVPRALVFQLPDDFAHARFVHSASETTAQRLGHGLQHQRFDHNGVVFLHQFGGEFVNGVVLAEHLVQIAHGKNVLDFLHPLAVLFLAFGS